ncbi:MAG: AAA family ATPase, partial [Nannocystaceae bacterium]
AGTETDLGLQLTSALVTELMPLVVALRHAQGLPFLVLEEPEAHLHPRLVRAVIRCLCRLVRRGVRVLITTHSATVAQQVNNLVKLGCLTPETRAEQQRRFGYSEIEYLHTEEVGAHEFRFHDDGRTVVESIVPDADGLGFPMRTFNEALHDFVDETLALNALLDPEIEQ